MARIRNVRCHVLRDTKKKEDLLVDEAGEISAELRENRVAFTSLLYHPGDGKIYCGVTAFNNDIFHRFDPAAGRFESLGYRTVAEPFEVKIHRSLCLAGDGNIYGASACLHKDDKRLSAPGGALFRLTPGADQPEKLGVPVSRDYIQTITLDQRRQLIYGLTYPVFKFFVYHIGTGEVEDYDYVGSITHLSALDDRGRFWGTWDRVAHRLFCYDPDRRQIHWHETEIPEGRAFSNIMYPGAGPVDTMINGGDGFLYIGTTGGTLCRLDPESARVEYLGRPAATTRLPCLATWRGPLLLGAAGDREGGVLFTYDRESGAFRVLGPLVDSRTGLKLYRVHDFCLIENAASGETSVFIAETDVPGRSGYLWECTLGD